MADPNSQSASQANAPAIETDSVLERILTEGRLIQGEDAQERVDARSWVSALVRDVVTDKMKVSSDLLAMIGARIAALDEAVSLQLNEVLHAPEFQRLEAAWRGLNYLVMQTETSAQLKIKVMNVTKKDLHRDLTTAADFDQSELYRKVHDEGFGVLGGEPYGCLIGDFEFGRNPQDIELLEKMSNVAAAAHAPFISAADPKMFNWERFTDLANVPDIEKVFQNDAYIRWRSFRDSEDSRYVGLALPHVLMRLPYGPETVPVEEFDFREDVSGKDHDKYLWGNAAYALGARITNAFALYGWCTAIRGVEGGGLVEGLPTHTFQTDQGDIAAKCPTEIAITDTRENEFSKMGFVPLLHYKGKDQAAFFGTNSCQKPKEYYEPDATANAKLSSQLQYIFATSRFAHYMKHMMRDKLGSFMSREQCQNFLNNWIANYVLLDDNANQAQKAQYPLRQAQIDVEEVKGRPGVYNAVAYLRPHFQLEGLNVSLRLVARLPTKA